MAEELVNRSLVPDDNSAADTLRLDLYAQVDVLAEPRLVRAAGVTFGRPTLHHLRPADLLGTLQFRPDHDTWMYTLLQFPFDLEPLPSGERYLAASVRVTFDRSDVMALAVGPPPGDVPVVGGVPLESEATVNIRGLGRHQPAWDVIAKDPAVGLQPVSRVIQTCLQLPPDMDALRGALDAEVRLARTWFRLVDTVKAASRAPVHFTMFLDGRFAFHST